MKEPYKYQEVAIQKALERSMLIADACGLGKTLTGVEIGKRLQEAPDMKSLGALVVCSKNKRADWIEEITGQECSGTILSLQNKKQDVTLLENLLKPCGPFWLVLHYEALVKYQKILAKIPWLLIIADEAQKIMNRKALRTKALKKLNAYRKVALTGTPMEYHTANAWSLINWLYPSGYGDELKHLITNGYDKRYFTSYWAFVDQFVDMRFNYLGYRYIAGNKNVDQFSQLIKPFFIRRLKTDPDVAPDLPPNIPKTILLEMESNQRTLYKRIDKADDIVVDLSDLVKIDPNTYDDNDYHSQVIKPVVIRKAIAKIIKLQQVTCHPSLLDENLSSIMSAKMRWVVDFVEENPDESIVFFTLFRNAALWLAKEIDADVAIGGVDSPVDFLTGKKKRLVGTLAYMAEGLNLQRASTAVFVDSHWSSILMSQAIDRIHRIDITEPKYTIYLYTKGTVDMLVKKAYERKWNQIDMVYQYLNNEKVLVP